MQQKYGKITVVMVFGTFDILHQGHKHFLQKAKKYGNFLIVIIARDATVKQVKGKLPDKNEKQRQQTMIESNLADKVVLGNLKNKYAIIKKFKPDVICLGYDQKYFVSQLENEIKKLKFQPKVFQPPSGVASHPLDKNTKIIRLKPYKAHIYKTSIIKKYERDEKKTIKRG